jgi:hypothetical protein
VKWPGLGDLMIERIDSEEERYSEKYYDADAGMVI